MLHFFIKINFLRKVSLKYNETLRNNNIMFFDILLLEFFGTEFKL